jgi:hypothetical protein
MKKLILLSTAFSFATIISCNEPEKTESAQAIETEQAEATAPKEEYSFFASVNGKSGSTSFSAKEMANISNIEIYDLAGNLIENIDTISFDLTSLVQANDGNAFEISKGSKSNMFTDDQKKSLLSLAEEGRKYFIENIKFKISGNNEEMTAKAISINIKG